MNQENRKVPEALNFAEIEQTIRNELISKHGWLPYEHFGRISLIRALVEPEVSVRNEVFATFDKTGRALSFTVGNNAVFTLSTVTRSPRDVIDTFVSNFDHWAKTIKAVFPSDPKLSEGEGSWVSVKVKNLIGAALDWAVAKAEGLPVMLDPMGFKTGSESGYWVWSNEPGGLQTKIGRGYSPSTVWAQGGLIVDRERPHMAPVTYNGEPSWQSWVCGQSSASGSFGSTFLIAAMRCHVTSRLGDEIEVPAALLQ